MIVKKIKNPVKSAAKSTRTEKLVDYIRSPEQKNLSEKCVYAGARGFLSDTASGQKAEMLALSQEAVRSKDPINHYVLSWREGEQPSREQVEEAVTIFMAELGLRDHQVIYGLHVDTDNIHLHLVINRVHPESLTVVKPNRGFDIEAAHKAIARIEHVQGWQREEHGRYQVLENGDLGREHLELGESRQPDEVKCDREQRTGEKSAERVAIEEGAPIIKRATSWPELHRELAAKGMRYAKTGSGATIFVGEVGVKASRVDRGASLLKLQKRLGLYQPPANRLPVAERAAVPVKNDLPGWDIYIAGRTEHYHAKEGAALEQKIRQEGERKELYERQRNQRREVLGRSWKGRGALRNVTQSVLAAAQAAEKAAVKERHRQERKQLRQQYPPYPDLEQWQRQQQHPELAEQWRHRAREVQHLAGETTEPPTLRDIRDYIAEIFGSEVHYTRKDRAGVAGGPAFVDKGRIIEIYDSRNRDSVLAALQLSAQKWRSIEVIGGDEFKARCVKLAAEHGFKISNPELRQSIVQERERIEQEWAQAKKLKQVREFELYHQAVSAERYRVTAIRIKADGGKMTFILDKRDGVTQGFTPLEIEQHTPEMLRMQRRGENIYYTPLSPTRHHILIDDLSLFKLDKLLTDGFQPAVVLESSPGNFQAIITVPKLGTPYDKEVGNRLTEKLNHRYGDPKLSGCIHPHRAPGYENRKPKHQRDDGSYPEVRLFKIECRECDKTLALAKLLDDERQRQEVWNRPIAKPNPELPNAAIATGSAIAAYQQHYKDILKRQKVDEVDLSRVDSMIAVRLRVTGHSQAEIEEALRCCAPTIRSKDEGRNWHDYAQRTARYAFGAAGGRQAADLAKYRPQWEKLEGREEMRPPTQERQKAKAQGQDEMEQKPMKKNRSREMDI